MEETAANTASYAISARFLEIRGSLNGRLTNSEEVEFFLLSLSLSTSSNIVLCIFFAFSPLLSPLFVFILERLLYESTSSK